MLDYYLNKGTTRVMCTEYCDYVLAALRVRYCDCCAVSLWHQVCPVLCTV